MPRIGQAEFEQLGIGGGGVSVVDRRRPAGEDEAEGLERLNLAEGRGAGQHDGEDVVFADAARNELRVLRTEVEDDDCLGVHVFSVAGRIPGLQGACGGGSCRPGSRRLRAMG